MATDSDKRPGDKPVDKRLRRVTVFRGLAGEKAIEATAAEIGALTEPDDADSRPPTPSDSDTDKAPSQARTAQHPATDSDKGATRSRDPSKS